MYRVTVHLKNGSDWDFEATKWEILPDIRVLRMGNSQTLSWVYVNLDSLDWWRVESVGQKE